MSKSILTTLSLVGVAGVILAQVYLNENTETKQELKQDLPFSAEASTHSSDDQIRPSNPKEFHPKPRLEDSSHQPEPQVPSPSTSEFSETPAASSTEALLERSEALSTEMKRQNPLPSPNKRSAEVLPPPPRNHDYNLDFLPHGSATYSLPNEFGFRFITPEDPNYEYLARLREPFWLEESREIERYRLVAHYFWF